MCIFSQSVESVSNTNIFARLDGDIQYLAYQMNYQSAVDLAMILPIPGDSVEFISLEEYPDFFKTLDSFFPKPAMKGLLSSRGIDTLRVHNVGSFVASFVPTLADFSRLDPQFTLSPFIWSKIPAYSHYGFVVFQLKSENTTVHPMAFKFSTRMPGRCFFPTKHIHDGQVHVNESFDHDFYCQGVSPNCPRVIFKGGTFNGMTKPGSFIYKYSAHGFLKNTDYIAGNKFETVN